MTDQISTVTAITQEMTATSEEITASIHEVDGPVCVKGEGIEEMAQQIVEQVASLQEINNNTGNLSGKALESTNGIVNFKC